MNTNKILDEVLAGSDALAKRLEEAGLDSPVKLLILTAYLIGRRDERLFTLNVGRPMTIDEIEQLGGKL